jgi:hypothetical protein
VVSLADRPNSWARELAQARVDDVVQCAAVCKPNAAGSHELTSWEGFGQRQIAKASGTYLGERCVLALTPLHAYVFDLLLQRWVGRALRIWPLRAIRADAVEPVRPRHDEGWPAVRITTSSACTLAELQVIACTPDAAHVLARLLDSPRRLTRSP